MKDILTDFNSLKPYNYDKDSIKFVSNIGKTTFVYWTPVYIAIYTYIEFHIDMLRMWEETLPLHNIDHDTDDIDEESEMEVCSIQDYK